jgi:hypothetical protein
VVSRARAARRLAEHLSGVSGVRVVVGWDNPSGRPGRGGWRVEWTDGPAVAAMRALAAAHARYVVGLDVTALCWARRYTPLAWAAALLAQARAGVLADTAGQAVTLAEYDLPDVELTGSAVGCDAAGELVRRGHGDPRQMATVLLAAGVTKPGDETARVGGRSTRCGRCGGDLPAPAATGRPARWCSAACRQAAHRQQVAGVTKRRHETSCPGCGRPVTVAGTGRPARWCSPACRTRAWRTRTGNH